jgi:polyhydroxyalkanoate synthase
MSPANFLATNPEAIELAVETGGQSLAEGMGLFFEDLAKGRISTTDETAFEVGRNVAVSPGAVIYENTLVQVIQYAPLTDEVRARPLVLIPPCINKFYILDLQPENSMVRYAVEQGHSVFLVSWRNVSAEQGRLTWDDYLRDGIMKAIDVAREVAGADKVNTLGFCVGGTLLASALAVMKARGEDKVASMTLLTSMLDFSDTGEIGTLVSNESVAAREAAIGTGGLMQGKELSSTFSSLRANDLMWQYVVNSYLKGKAPPAFDILYWNSESTNLPGPMFCWYVRNTYLENNLASPGKTVQCGVPVDLAQIDVPAFVYASREDHIVPWRTAYASTQILSGESTFVLGASGHIAGVINPPAKQKRNYWAGGAAGPDPENWLSTAKSVRGSWWPAWTAWLAQHAGPRVPARAALGNESYRAIEPAPGRYVKVKAE